MFKPLILFQIVFITSTVHSQTSRLQPEQIHLSYGASQTQMIVTWTTLDRVNESIVQYGVDQLNYKATGTVKEFKNSFFFARITWIHSVLINNLIPGQKYGEYFVDLN